VQGSGAVGELAVQDQERQAPEVVAVQVRHQHQPDLVGILVLLFEGDQRGGAAVQQHVAVVAGGVQQDAGLEAAPAAEGVTGADEPHLDESLGHTPTLPCANRPGEVSGDGLVAEFRALSRARDPVADIGASDGLSRHS